MTNPDVTITDQEVISERWGTLTLTRFRQRRRDGQSQTRTRESYDRGNGTVVLPYDRARRTVLLSRQFRLPAYLNGHADGMLLEAAAGMVEPGEDPAQTIRREAVEELGVELTELEHLFRVYMSPGATTEYLDCYAAAYSPAARSAAGGGLAEEGEDIEVLEYDFDVALAAIAAGSIVDAKTIMLLQWAALTGPFAAGAEDRREASGPESRSNRGAFG